MDGRYTYHRYNCSGMVYASGPKPTYQIGSSNYITIKVWYENGIITKEEIVGIM
jgi:hypothetical protein